MFQYFLKYWLVNAAVLAVVFVLQAEVEGITAWHPIFVVVTLCVICSEKVPTPPTPPAHLRAVPRLLTVQSAVMPQHGAADACMVNRANLLSWQGIACCISVPQHFYHCGDPAIVSTVACRVLDCFALQQISESLLPLAAKNSLFCQKHVRLHHFLGMTGEGRLAGVVTPGSLCRRWTSQ